MSTDGNTSASSGGGPTADTSAASSSSAAGRGISAAAKPALIARPPLDVYKKIAIIRKESDEVVYQDATGSLRKIADLAKASTSTVGFVGDTALLK